MVKFLEGLNWIVILGILVAVETQIGNGTMSLANMVPDTWIPFVKAWAANLGTLGALIMSAGAFGRPSAPTETSIPSAMKPLILFAVLILGTLALPGDAMAQGLIKKPQITGNVVADTRANLGIGGAPSGSPLGNILGALDDKLLPDLQYALKLATASGSKVTAPCYQAWIDIIATRQKAVTDASGQPIDLPNPRLITDFEKVVELRNALQPDSDFMLKCSPVASMVRKDIIGFIGIVISGGAGLAALGL